MDVDKSAAVTVPAATEGEEGDKQWNFIPNINSAQQSQVSVGLGGVQVQQQQQQQTGRGY